MTAGLLGRLTARLDTAGVAWGLDARPGSPVSEVVLRVGSAPPALVDAALRACGFARSGPGAAVLGHDAGDRWLRVAVVGEPVVGEPVAGEPAGGEPAGGGPAGGGPAGGDHPAAGVPGPRGHHRVRRAVAAARRGVPARWPVRRGLTVALLGPDGAGKSTLLAGLQAAYPLPVRSVYMGLWQGAGRPGRTRLDAVVAIVVRPFRVWWCVARAAVHAARGRVVLFDRYTYDALLPVTGGLRWLKRPYLRVLGHLAPRPDLVLVLDVPGAVALARKPGAGAAELEAERQGFLGLAPRVAAEVVDAAASPDEVRAEATARIWRRHRERLAR